MPTYIVLLNYTDQGIRGVKDTTKRAKAFREMASKAGMTVKDFFWTLGSYDLVTIVEGKSAEDLTAVLLATGSLGNVRTQTLRAFNADELDKILDKIPKG